MTFNDLRVGILTSHPIQYQTPWFRELAKRVDLEVFFAHREDAVEQGRAGFGLVFEWDIDLLSGYKHTFLHNVSRRPNAITFFGCDTPQISELICGRTPNSRLQAPTFDAFIVTGWHLKSYWQAIRACRRNGIPVFVRGDSQLDPTSPLLKRAIKQLTHRLALQQFNGFLSVGQRNREYLVHYGVPENKIFFAPHSVDNDRFAKQAEAVRDSKFEIREAWGIPRDAFCVLFCGKFIPEKRPLDLVKAVRLLLQSDPELELHLLFVGSGQLGQQLRTECNAVFDAEKASSSLITHPASLPPATFAGFLNQTQVSRAYVAADCLVLPSESETWGLAVNESMASGLPAIVSDAVGCAPDLVEEDKTGFAFRVRDCGALASKLKLLAQLKRDGYDFRSVINAKSREYSVEAAVSGTLDALRKILGKRD